MPYREANLIVEQFDAPKKVLPNVCNICLLKPTTIMCPTVWCSESNVMPGDKWMAIFLCDDCNDAWIHDRTSKYQTQMTALSAQNHKSMKMNYDWDLPDYIKAAKQKIEPAKPKLSFWQRIGF